jgi:hypothetical protein
MFRAFFGENAATHEGPHRLIVVLAARFDDSDVSGCNLPSKASGNGDACCSTSDDKNLVVGFHNDELGEWLK